MSVRRPTESLALIERAHRVIPGSVNSWTRWTDVPLSASRALGAHIWDLDGNDYLDFHGAYSAIVLGHSYPAVAQAVADRIQSLVLVGIGRTPDEVELAERLVRCIPSAEQVLLTTSGSQATYYAIRLARAVTGRECVVKFAGCFHGDHDYAFRGSTADGKADDGILEAAARTVLTVPYNDLEAVETLFRNRGANIAAAIVEPIAYNISVHPEPGFLEGLREITTAYDSLLIFDEVITGFRTGLGGAQERLGVAPDLTTLGKAMANGFPIAALVGPERHMMRFTTTLTGRVPFSGTYNGNAVGVSAANATLSVMATEHVHEHLYRLGDRMRDGLRQIVRELGVEAVVTGYGSIYNLLFTEEMPKSAADVERSNEALFLAYRNELWKRRILEMPLPFMRAQITYSHTDDDVDRALEASRDALTAARDRVASVRPDL